jgi:hypothetical protein
MRTLVRSAVFALPIAAILVLRCKEKIVTPPPTNPRDYTWTVDTLTSLGSFQTMMQDMWGSAPNNLYVVGHNSSGSDMFRFDGRSWSEVKLLVGQGGTISDGISLSAIYGFTAEDIWAVGRKVDYNPNPPPNFLDSSVVIHFDGRQWSEFRVSGGRSLQGIWGISPTDLWAGGIEGTLYHFEGNAWKKMDQPANHWFFCFTGFGIHDIYALAYEVDPVSLLTFYLLHWDGNTWTLEDSFKETGGGGEDKFGGGKIFAIGGHLFSAGRGVFKKTASGWEKILSTRGTYLRDIDGNSSDNLFAVGNFSAVYHFNGADWYRYPQFTDRNIHYNASWTDGREVFIVGYDGPRSYILHGK